MRHSALAFAVLFLCALVTASAEAADCNRALTSTLSTRESLTVPTTNQCNWDGALNSFIAGVDQKTAFLDQPNVFSKNQTVNGTEQASNFYSPPDPLLPGCEGLFESLNHAADPNDPDYVQDCVPAGGLTSRRTNTLNPNGTRPLSSLGAASQTDYGKLVRLNALSGEEEPQTPQTPCDVALPGSYAVGVDAGGAPLCSQNALRTLALTGVSLNGVQVGNENTVNLIPGPGIGLTANDNPGSNRVDVTFTNNAAAVFTPIAFYARAVDTGNLGASSTTETAIDATITTLDTVGRVLSMTQAGTVAVAAGTLTLRVKIAGSAVLTFAPTTLSASGRPYDLTVTCITRATGASGTEECKGRLEIDDGADDGILNNNILKEAATGPIDLTGNVGVQTTFQFGTSNSGNAVNGKSAYWTVANVAAAITSATTTTTSTSTSTSSSSSTTSSTAPGATTTTTSSTTTTSTIVSAVYDVQGNTVDFGSVYHGEFSTVSADFRGRQFLKVSAGSGSHPIRRAHVCMGNSSAPTTVTGLIRMAFFGNTTVGCPNAWANCPDDTTPIGGASSSLDVSTITAGATFSTSGACDGTADHGQYVDFTWPDGSLPTLTSDSWIVFEVVSGSDLLGGLNRINFLERPPTSYPPACSTDCGTYSAWMSNGGSTQPPNNATDELHDIIMTLFE